ncbi:TetR/AcrR family transcriptional regulator [Catellatospora coxensis]|uniref:TetR family transcriptional regulator n=1 Tax=Catellatospora coxensis TaxID=310354 RepID=A0A8J3L1N5_9ACTN|nr:TetR/AcrR family transcriptional regulator [Catellatospora coxensis]GIG10850.1 TetR family transcriptional regulator [Catellatospora coxensis]
MTNDSREKMVRAAALLLAERGYAATSFQDVIARSGAPRGSIYHHFPGGKEQLAAEALRWYAGRTRTGIGGAPALDAVAGYFTATANWLRKNEFQAGCPVAGVALDVGQDDPLHAVVAAAFADWRGVLESAFAAEGCPQATARALAALVIASAEGALLLARAERDLRPYQDVADQVLAHLRATLPATHPHDRDKSSILVLEDNSG